MTYYMLLFSGWGDGSGGNAITGISVLPFYIPSVYLFSLFLCSFRFIKGSALVGAAIVVYGLLAASVVVLVLAGPVMVLGLPLPLFGWAAYPILFRDKTPNPFN